MTIKRLLQFIFLFYILSLCSCATRGPIYSQLPPETSFNLKSSLQGQLLVTLTLESGDKLPFAVDTGVPYTILDKSLEPKLGKRVGKGTIEWVAGTNSPASIYIAPKLYLDNTQLLTGRRVRTCDLHMSPVMGILGMDCLRHYCIQLDFANSKMRFLDPKDLKTSDLGKAYQLSIIFGVAYACPDFLDNNKMTFRIDTGFRGEPDFMIKPSLFRWEMREQKPFGQTDGNFVFFTNNFSMGGEPTPGVGLKTIEFGGEDYTNVVVVENVGNGWLRENFVGLHFFERNLVTFNFPNRVMYLKPESIMGQKMPPNTAPEPTPTAPSVSDKP